MPMMTDERESSYAKNMPSSIIKSRRNEGDVLRHVKREGIVQGECSDPMIVMRMTKYRGS